MKNLMIKLILYPIGLLLSTQALAVGLVWGEGSWGSDWQEEGVVPAPPPATTPPPTPPASPSPAEALDNIVSGINIPTGEGESISEETFNTIAEGATTSANLAQSLADSILDADDNDVIDTLNAFGSLASFSGSAAQQSISSGNSAGASSSGNSGKQMISSFSTLLSALDGKTNNSENPGQLTGVQKEVVQQAVVKAVASAVNVLSALPESGDARKAVLQDLGKIVSSTANLGVALTQTEANSLLEATEQSASAGSDIDTQLESSIPIKPANKALLSRDTLNQALGGAASEAELDSFLQELANAINPADVSIGGITGEQSLNDGFVGALGGGASGSVSFDPGTGVMTFAITEIGQTGSSLRSISALSTGKEIAGRVISANVVSSAFPDGVSLRANGAIVIASNRIASLLVPASADPVNFYADLRKLGLTTSVGDDGNLKVRDGDYYYSGTFDFVGVEPGVSDRLSTSFIKPEGQDEADPNYYFTVVYRDGRSQRIQPFVMADSFLSSLTERGLSATINRNTGVVSAGGLRYRPSYFVIPANAEEEAFRQAKADSTGIAYRAIHANDDGVVDIQVISAQGVQTVFGLAR